MCEICGLRATTSGSLSAHRRRHETGCRLKCDQCDFTATSRSALASHRLRRHTNRRFQCDQCEYVARRSCHLNQHMHCHTGKKPFKCDACDFATAWRFNLIHHKRRKHSKMEDRKLSNKCTDVCGSEFSSLSELTLHMIPQHNTGNTAVCFDDVAVTSDGFVI